ncbi:MAG: ABC transporter substrate-binding protein [Schwartzia sp. (in: firmicutes)]
MKNVLHILGVLALALCAVVFSGCGGEKTAKRELKVYNAGDYIDPDFIKAFEKETGIRIIYDTWATNEDMYVKVKAGGSDYDLVIPSDYMIERMRREDMLEKIDFTKVPNYALVDEKFKNLYYDPKNEYSVPYMWGTVGIIYNRKMVEDPVDSWGILWNPKYAKQIFVMDSIRDSVGMALKYRGYSLNASDDAALTAARDALIAQKPLVQAYVVDEVKDKMIAGEGALAVVWSGDAVFMMEKNPDLAYALPKEGTNVWIDAMVILKGGKHKAEAEEFINFMTRPDIAKKNVEYIGYASPIPEVVRQLPPEVQKDTASYPSAELLKNAEYFHDVGENLSKYDKVWTEVKVAK